MEIVLTETTSEVHGEHMVQTAVARPIVGPSFEVHLARLYEGRTHGLGPNATMTELDGRRYSIGGAAWWVIFAVVLPGLAAFGLLVLIGRVRRQLREHRQRRQSRPQGA